MNEDLSDKIGFANLIKVLEIDNFIEMGLFVYDEIQSEYFDYFRII